jgi:hypothetical protein
VCFDSTPNSFNLSEIRFFNGPYCIFLLGLFACISSLNFLIPEICFSVGDCIKSGAVAGGFSGLYSKVNKGGGYKMASSNPYLFIFVSGTFFLSDENNKVNKLFFFCFSNVLKFILFGLMVFFFH